MPWLITSMMVLNLVQELLEVVLLVKTTLDVNSHMLQIVMVRLMSNVLFQQWSQQKPQPCLSSRFSTGNAPKKSSTWKPK